MTPEDLWAWMPKGYLFTISIETTILLIGLSARHSWKVRLFCGVWLTACTYPIVVLVLPLLLPQGHLAAMAMVTVLIFSERLEQPMPLRWRWRGFGKLIRILVSQARIHARANT